MRCPTRIVASDSATRHLPSWTRHRRPHPRATPDRRAAQRARQARKRRRGWLAFLFVLLLTAIAALAGWYLTDGRFTTAPALTC